MGAQGGEGMVEHGPGGLGAGAGEDFDGGGEARARLGFGFQSGETRSLGAVRELEEAFLGGGEVALQGEQLVVGKGFRGGVPEVQWRGAAMLGRGGKSGSHGGTEVIL
jgi:hypothetical protein